MYFVFLNTMLKIKQITVHVRPIVVNITANTNTGVGTVTIVSSGIPSDGTPTEM